jgi:RNA polymerase sigma factor (sigma-70 family)
VSTVPADLSGKSDAELIESVRTGKIAAYGVLYERHATAAHNLARQLARSGAEADDLVSEAFAKVLDTLRAGKGPDTAFRAYLLTALRHTAYDKTRKDKRIDLTEDMTDVGGAVGEALTVQFSDTAVAGLERTMAAKAFAKLPERWQAVLWHTEIEQQMPAEVAPSLGLTANGVSALAYRAREGLRQAYLQVHLAETSAERCRAPAERLGAWTRDGLSKREGAQVEAHLDECDRCRALAAELADVNSGLRLIVAPIVLGGAVTGYLSAAGAAKASAAAAGTVFASAGAASSTSAGVGAAAAGPRQFAGVVASGVAVPAAAGVALAAGGGAQQVPAAAQSPAPTMPPQAPALQPPTVTTQTPPQGVELQAGTPANLPITVRNNGGTCSEPVVVTLKLPPGITVSCPGGSGTVTCKTRKGLEPGQSAVLTFRLVADQTTEGGMVTGSVTAGSQLKVSVAVKVNVKARRTPSTCWSPAPGTRRSRGSGTRSCASKSSTPGRRLSP